MGKLLVICNDILGFIVNCFLVFYFCMLIYLIYICLRFNEVICSGGYLND